MAIVFTLNPDKCYYMSWVGKYTHGYAWCRGTDVSFFPKYAAVWQRSNEGILDFDHGSLRGENPCEVADQVKAFECIDTEYWKNSTYSETVKGWNEIGLEVTCTDEEMIKSVPVMEDHGSFPVDKLFQIYSNQDEIENELRAVQVYGDEHGVTFHWI